MLALEKDPRTYTTSPVELGPLPEEGMLSTGLDYYKPTMSQFVYEKEPGAEVTFTFKNRGEQRLLDYVDLEALAGRFEQIRERGFSRPELDFLASVVDSEDERMFSDEYLKHVTAMPLSEVNIAVENDDIAISSTGEWAMTTFWETVVMSEVNEAYFEGFVRQEGIDLFELYEEGDRRLSEKIAFLQQHPEIKVAEFGTRRRFSLRWQRHVIERLKNECPDNLIGTSNVGFANTLGLKPVGTFAHELPMAYAGLAEVRNKLPEAAIRQSHGKLLDDWYDFYGDELAVALSDTFGSDFFFEDFTPERTENYRATRQDSGDPLEYAQKTIAHYEENGVDPATKTIFFSDGLDMDKVKTIAEAVKGRINAAYGIGTDLSNDLGIKALNVVMKLTHVKDLALEREADTVKLSDNPGKHTGPPEKVEQYREIFNGN